MSSDSSARDRHWSLQIFRMTGERRQQRCLEAFDRVGVPGVHVLGVLRPDGWFLVVDSASIADEVRARRIVRSVDPASTRVLVTSPRRHRDVTLSRRPSATEDAAPPTSLVVVPPP